MSLSAVKKPKKKKQLKRWMEKFENVVLPIFEIRKLFMTIFEQFEDTLYDFVIYEYYVN